MRKRIDGELQKANMFLAVIESHTDFAFGQLESREEVVIDYKGDTVLRIGLCLK